jgi:hypothetical protein
MIRTYRRLAGAVIAAACLTAPMASANDSSAELTTGGLVLTKHPAIEMRSEDLYVSAKLVRFRYLFVNTSAEDLTTLVAFPMPDITIEGEDDMLSIPTEDPRNILAFATTVNGKPVRADVEQKAVKDGVDRTAYLRAMGIPIGPHLRATNTVVDALPQAKKDELIKAGLAQIMEYNSGKGWERHAYATWTLKTTWFWRQTFPAGKEVVIEHRYKPSVGTTSGTGWGSPWSDPSKDPEYPARRRHYCVDDDFLAAIGRVMKATNAQSPPFTEERIEYVLRTGANWKAPIGDFRLVVDKGDASSLISFCGEGVRKISTTQFEVRRTNFTPTQDLSILILKRGGIQ